MVAKITTPKSIEAALNYNEKNVYKGNAVCLHTEIIDAADKLNEEVSGYKEIPLVSSVTQ